MYFAVHALDDAGASQTAQAQTSTQATVRVSRTTVTNQSTIGALSVDGTDVSGYTLEPPGPSSTTAGSGQRIQAGEYDLVPFTRPNGDQVYQLSGVEGRNLILMHTGNLPAHTTGCLLPGTTTTSNAVWSSGTMTTQLFNTLQNYDSARIIITDDF